MNTTETDSGISADLAAEFPTALDDLARGVRRPSWPNLGRRRNEVKGQLTGEAFRALIRLLRAREPTEATSVLSRLQCGGKALRGR